MRRAAILAAVSETLLEEVLVEGLTDRELEGVSAGSTVRLARAPVRAAILAVATRDGRDQGRQPFQAGTRRYVSVVEDRRGMRDNDKVEAL